MNILHQKYLLFEANHPYSLPCVLSFAIAAFILFFTPPLYVADLKDPVDTIEFVNIEEANQPRRIVGREVSTVTGDEKAAFAGRAEGTGNEESAIELSFYPNIAVPKPIGRLKKIYPRSAREMNLEATVNLELLIAPDGRVQKVLVLGVGLSKELPNELKKTLAGEFAAAAIQILTGAQFSPAILNGKRVPVRMDLPLRFRLEDAS